MLLNLVKCKYKLFLGTDVCVAFRTMDFWSWFGQCTYEMHLYITLANVFILIMQIAVWY